MTSKIATHKNYLYDVTLPYEIPCHTNSQNYNLKNTKIKYHCDEDYIEVPGGSESVTWTDEDGQSYEIDISDLQEYDGDDGEIKYTKPINDIKIGCIMPNYLSELYQKTR